MTTPLQSNAGNTSLTEYEVAGLRAAFTFADGHAYHNMPKLLIPVMQNLHGIWQDATKTSIPEMEERFKISMAKIIKSPTLEKHRHYSLCPTASNSIDIAGAWLKTNNYNVGLLEPAFDNLYLLLKRRQINITSIQEEDLTDLDKLKKKIADNNLDSLFIVSPNNPTGFQMNEQEFSNLCGFCAGNGIKLVVDTTFRLYSRNGYDEYKILEDAGVDYVVIEDTGKTWPTEDLKVSMMAYSKSISAQMRELYEEVYLCSSNFTVALLGNLIDHTITHGVDKVIWADVDKRKAQFRQAIAGTPLLSGAKAGSCPMPMEWLDCSKTGMSDLELVDMLKKHDIALLPGRFFYWASQETHTAHVRAALMRPDTMFTNGLNTLKSALHKNFGIPSSGPAPHA